MKPVSESAAVLSGQARIMSAASAAAQAIPPAWPLDATVAVNPYLGQAHETLACAAARLARVAGTPMTMPRAWYREQLGNGRIADDDLAAALDAAREANPDAGLPESVGELRAAVEHDAATPNALPSIAELAAEASSIDWPALIADRVGAWASGYFDVGQAQWAAPQRMSAFTAWVNYATHDLTPEIQGLSGFCRRAAEAPDTVDRTMARVVERIGLPDTAQESYFHRLLMALGGWAQLARCRLWEAELSGATDTTVIEFLAIRLLWEEALYDQYREAITARWREAREKFAEPVGPSREHLVDALLQEAAERAFQRRLAGSMIRAGKAETKQPDQADRPLLQAAFCIDVRSEVFRRALESQDPAIETIGFAGFFGIATEHRRFASDVEERRLPALLNPAVSTCATALEDIGRDRKARLVSRARRAWGRFKLAAVSSFAFVEAMGPVYAGKLLRDGLALAEPATPADPPPRFDPPLETEERIDAAEQVLRAMSLTERFARVVIIAGHGARVTNNPHASALHCGACGGYSGEVNARLLAGLLNEPEVRSGLATRGIAIPEETLFIGAFHDTTTDAVHIYDSDHPDTRTSKDLKRIRLWLERAGRLARAERAPRLPGARSAGNPIRRSRNWAEVRPEWGLAGCSAFIAAPRSRTSGTAFDGRVFLHDYHWQRDQDFQVLELILTAPVVVACWISLQYYGSIVAPETFGAGNKLLHNVTGGMGVVEGNGGLLRVGLPWQSVHDGERPVHDPLRLSVCIEAPTEAITRILERNPQVRTLFDQGWLHLFALDAQGRMANRYVGALAWQDVDTPADKTEV
ncbi:MAG: DUF2309 domain-containing protein [Xanthomonadales bacterium]|nr:DUF2309 domain-containing protein [Xanthomonadales bacterium]